jgi:hypothetical protein
MTGARVDPGKRAHRTSISDGPVPEVPSPALAAVQFPVRAIRARRPPRPFTLTVVADGIDRRCRKFDGFDPWRIARLQREECATDLKFRRTLLLPARWGGQHPRRPPARIAVQLPTAKPADEPEAGGHLAWAASTMPPSSCSTKRRRCTATGRMSRLATACSRDGADGPRDS